MDISNYKHKIIEVVKFHEVDMLSVCNNAVYFNYFEDARIKYMQDIKKNYALKVYTRIEFIKNSSFGFRHIIEKAATKTIIAKGGGVVVHIDRSNNKSLPLPQEFYDAVQNFEKDVVIQRSTNV